MKTRLDTRRLDQIIAAHPQRAGEIVRGAAFAVEGKAKTLAPVDTGALKNSLHTEMRGKLTAVVADGVEYGIYQEFGTSRMGAHPFLVPAVEWIRPRWVEMWRALI